MNSNTLGVFFAVIAMFSWGFGDFLIQKVSRTLGIWKCIFFISIIGTIGLIPFVWNDLSTLKNLHDFWFFGIAAFTMLIASLLDFEALKEGKLAIMEPIISTELPIAAILAIVLWHESLTFLGWILVLVIFIGTVLAVTEHHTQLHYHKRIFEKGVIFAFATALCMGLLDLLMGVSSQEAAPLLTVWVVWVFVGAVSFIYLMHQNKLKEIKKDFFLYPTLLIGLGILDTLGWIGYCLATVHIPISITTAIAESYVSITIVLGLLINHEHIKKHQELGVLFAFIGVILLALLVG